MPVHNWQMGCYEALLSVKRRWTAQISMLAWGVQSKTDTYQFYKQKVGSFQIWLSRMTTRAPARVLHFTIEPRGGQTWLGFDLRFGVLQYNWGLNLGALDDLLTSFYLSKVHLP